MAIKRCIGLLLCIALWTNPAKAQTVTQHGASGLGSSMSPDVSWSSVSRNSSPCHVLAPAVGGLAGAFVGAFIGYRIDRAIENSGESPGLNGLLLGGLLGAVGGAVLGSSTCNDAEEDRIRNEIDKRRYEVSRLGRSMRISTDQRLDIVLPRRSLPK